MVSPKYPQAESKIQSFTKKYLDELPNAEPGKRSYYKDSKVNGLEIMVTDKGNKSFKVTKKKNGRIIRVTIGTYPDISIENARKEAFHISAQIAQGINPNEEKHKVKSEITFGEMFHQFMERYSKKHKKSWIYDEREVNKFCIHWFKRKASSITKQEIQQLHEKIGDINGKTQANRLLERIRAIYNKNIEWGWEAQNPTNGIKKFKEKSRDRFLQADELPRFFEALNEEENEIAKDYILISLLTGARKSNVLAMKWKEINFQAKTWRIPETKNGEALTIPLTDQALEILYQRQVDNLNAGFKDSEFVFPSKSSSGHLVDPKKAWKRVLEKARIDDLRIHDLRRTLGSWQAATGATTAIIGKSLGHRSHQATRVYERLNIDPVRDSVERATKAMFVNMEKIEKI
ncbi:tyrosine-type recombinase/integrase [Rickettsiales endosymbiont of Stachyamoeba lipophora]|uniref:tyrosine-type recombinase/integrase n=1 Tax=Rickettsiales endosymbiont of Stachyamoeba lipophora TaxID=2486578 RepID=UPI000F651DB5|nr:site-specific integrase [Rickettsiales endosymbiont of Stachyamoeba lipophora]AZL15276.1 site-specific integrase [Rickettsiales endosymbiont of Stachyamoeba lipophora]